MTRRCGHFSRAAQRDPRFGLAYAGMAIASRNIDRQQDAEKYIKQAVSQLDGMTERERYRTRGLFYMITGDSGQCVKEFGDLIARYAADAVGAQQPRAVSDLSARHAARRWTKCGRSSRSCRSRALYRENLALYAAYAGDFETAEQEALAIEEPESVRLAGAGLRPARPGAGASSHRDVPGHREDRRAGGVLSGVRSRAISRCTRDVSPMRPGFSRKGRPRIWPRRTPTARRTSSPRWPTRRSFAGSRAPPLTRPRRRSRTATP